MAVLALDGFVGDAHVVDDRGRRRRRGGRRGPAAAAGRVAGPARARASSRRAPTTSPGIANRRALVRGPGRGGRRPPGRRAADRRPRPLQGDQRPPRPQRRRRGAARDGGAAAGGRCRPTRCWAGSVATSSPSCSSATAAERRRGGRRGRARGLHRTGRDERGPRCRWAPASGSRPRPADRRRRGRPDAPRRHRDVRREARRGWRRRCSTRRPTGQAQRERELLAELQLAPRPGGVGRGPATRSRSTSSRS